MPNSNMLSVGTLDWTDFGSSNPWWPTAIDSVACGGELRLLAFNAYYPVCGDSGLAPMQHASTGRAPAIPEPML